mmetsp:Transcript_8192/g.36241  ORF Transcript_8192/g.36241 Transcript_8192/m.36241 type:complete len:293 (+) Transcript_8192:2193-3071(+)
MDPTQPLRPSQDDARGDLDAVRGGRQARRDPAGDLQRGGAAADGEKPLPGCGPEAEGNRSPVRRLVPARGRRPAHRRGRRHDPAETRPEGQAQRHRGREANHIHGSAPAPGVRRQSAGGVHETRPGRQSLWALQRREARRSGSSHASRGGAPGFAQVPRVAERRVPVPVHKRVRRGCRVHRRSGSLGGPPGTDQEGEIGRAQQRGRVHARHRGAHPRARPEPGDGVGRLRPRRGAAPDGDAGGDPVDRSHPHGSEGSGRCRGCRRGEARRRTRARAARSGEREGAGGTRLRR